MRVTFPSTFSEAELLLVEQVSFFNFKLKAESVHSPHFVAKKGRQSKKSEFKESGTGILD